MLPALLHATAFAIALFVQFWGSPLAGAWVFFHLAGCAALLYGGGYPKRQGVVWHLSLAWLLALGASAFLFAPVRNGASVMWVLAAMPMLAVSLRKEHLKPYLGCFLTAAALYAAGLVAQLALNTHTEFFNYEGRHSWPLLDPNNAAAVVNMALLPCVYLTLFRDFRWAAPSALFVTALFATGSKAGFAVAGLGVLTFLSVKLGLDFLLLAAGIGAIEVVGLYFYRPELILLLVNSFRDRFPIWEASLPLAFLRPFQGLGLGTFGHYYEQVRTEQYTVGWHSHNDVLQVAVEMGIPAALLLCSLIAAVAFTTRRANLAAAAVVLAVAAQAMVEFQFYIPAVSIPMGLALGCHILSRKATK
jgi:O-antigen ligase